MSVWVYILASKMHGTLYVGVTSNLARRIEEHRLGQAGAFTARYRVFRLVWCAEFADPTEGIAFEKRLKRWHRDWKIRLIEEENPLWTDLAPVLLG